MFPNRYFAKRYFPDRYFPVGEEQPVPPIIVVVGGGGRSRPLVKMPWAWPWKEEYLPEPRQEELVQHASSISIISVEVEVVSKITVSRRSNSVQQSEVSVAVVYRAGVTYRIKEEIEVSSIIISKRGIADELWLLDEEDNSEEAFLLRK